jgi:Holliday junction DNA helicase RuvB
VADLAALEEFRERTRVKSPRPQTWDEVVGNPVAKEQLKEGILAAKKLGRPMPHTILFGPPGTGKSTLSMIAARETGGFFVGTTASTWETNADVLRTIWQLNQGCEAADGAPSTFFMDEIHMLGQAKGRQAVDQESIFPLIEDWVFPHNLIRKTVEDVNGKEWVITKTESPVLPFTFIGATTEPGMLSQPLLRRFMIHVELQPYTEAEIAQILLGSAQRLEWKLTENAAADLARFSRRNPGTAMQILTSANSRAISTDRELVDSTVVAEIVDRMNLYPLGLNETDVRILQILYERSPRGVGMAELCRAAGISQSQFTGMIESYLRLLGFMETLSRRVIRPEGIRYLKQIGKILDSSRPEVRAALGNGS